MKFLHIGDQNVCRPYANNTLIHNYMEVKQEKLMTSLHEMSKEIFEEMFGFDSLYPNWESIKKSDYFSTNMITDIEHNASKQNIDQKQYMLNKGLKHAIQEWNHEKIAKYLYQLYGNCDILPNNVIQYIMKLSNASVNYPYIMKLYGELCEKDVK